MKTQTHRSLLFCLILTLSLSACRTGPEQNILAISNAHVILVDSAMIGWAAYVKTGKADPEDILKVKNVYNVYFQAAQAEKAAWVAWVSSRDLDAVRRAERIVLEMRQPLLELLLQVDQQGAAFEAAAERQTEERKGEVTIEDIEWAFTFLRPYASYNIPEK